LSLVIIFIYFNRFVGEEQTFINTITINRDKRIDMSESPNRQKRSNNIIIEFQVCQLYSETN
jgi:hypothetical protein